MLSLSLYKYIYVNHNQYQAACIWIPIATTSIVNIQKKRIAWTRIDMPLVPMLPNSITRWCAGSWNSSPGDNSMNNITATTIGPQSVDGDIFLKLLCVVQMLNPYVAFLSFGEKKWWMELCMMTWLWWTHYGL